MGPTLSNVSAKCFWWSANEFHPVGGLLVERFADLPHLRRYSLCPRVAIALRHHPRHSNPAILGVRTFVCLRSDQTLLRVKKEVNFCCVLVRPASDDSDVGDIAPCVRRRFHFEICPHRA